MNTKIRKQILARIRESTSDSRYKAPAAQIQINAPLALIQVCMKAEVNALRWVLGLKEKS
jgi:hypothetical protein